ncbi:hypothetical protein Tco_1361069 [Tanacetum coccineum]
MTMLHSFERSLDPLYGDYIKLNDLNEPLELRINQVKDLGPTIKDGEVIDEPIKDIIKTRNDHNEMSNGINVYPSFCDYDKKIHIDCAYNLQFSCMLVMENMDAYRDDGMGDVIVGKPFYWEVCVKARRFDVMITIYNDDTIVEVMENMDAYRDEGMGDVIVRKPFSREICFKGRRFDRMITIYNGNDSVTYQMVSARDELNGVSHPYQKLKSLYKGVLNLGPEYIRDAKIEELLTRGHVSIL